MNGPHHNYIDGREFPLLYLKCLLSLQNLRGGLAKRHTCMCIHINERHSGILSSADVVKCAHAFTRSTAAQVWFVNMFIANMDHHRPKMALLLCTGPYQRQNCSSLCSTAMSCLCSTAMVYFFLLFLDGPSSLDFLTFKGAMDSPSPSPSSSTFLSFLTFLTFPLPSFSFAVFSLALLLLSVAVLAVLMFLSYSTIMKSKRILS